jgi:hypothetical protein
MDLDYEKHREILTIFLGALTFVDSVLMYF